MWIDNLNYNQNCRRGKEKHNLGGIAYLTIQQSSTDVSLFFFCKMSVLYMKTNQIINSNAPFPAPCIQLIGSNAYKNVRIPPRTVVHCEVPCKTLHVYTTIYIHI